MMIVIRQRKEQKTGGLCSGNGDENVRQTTNIVVLEESINHFFFPLSLRLNRVSLHVTLIYSHLFHTLTRIFHSAPLSLFTTMQQYR